MNKTFSPSWKSNFYSLFTQAPLSGGVSAADHTFPSCIADAHYLIPAAVCRPNKSGARRRRGSVWANLLSERLLKAWHPSCCGAAALGRNRWPPLPRSIYSCAQFTSRVCVCVLFSICRMQPCGCDYSGRRRRTVSLVLSFPGVAVTKTGLWFVRRPTDTCWTDTNAVTSFFFFFCLFLVLLFTAMSRRNKVEIGIYFLFPLSASR